MSNDSHCGKRGILCCLVFSLILIVAGREAPEFASLTDDASNDGMAASWRQQTVGPASSLQMVSHEAPLSYTHSQPFSLTILRGLSPGTPISSTAGQDLLHRLSLQRK
jgi:hypothetical protein